MWYGILAIDDHNNYECHLLINYCYAFYIDYNTLLTQFKGQGH